MNKKLLLITSIICALPLVFAAMVYGQLPDTIATHWDLAGNANGWMPKLYAAFGLPLFLLAIHVLGITVVMHDPKRQNQGRVPQMLTYWIVPVVSVVTTTMTLLIGLGHKVNIGIFVYILVGVLFIVLGNYLPKSRQNYTIGIKLPWTLASTDNWNKTHRLGGILFILGGAALLVSVIVPSEIVRNIVLGAVIVLVAFVPMIYSFLLYLKESKN